MQTAIIRTCDGGKIRQRFLFNVHGYFEELFLDYLNFHFFSTGKKKRLS